MSEVVTQTGSASHTLKLNFLNISRAAEKLQKTMYGHFQVHLIERTEVFRDTKRLERKPVISPLPYLKIPTKMEKACLFSWATNTFSQQA